jgi:alkylhydroperoxidase/carboxymuconolactone decarboxylase family protein YurZ
MMRLCVGLLALAVAWGAAAEQVTPSKRLCALELYGGQPWLAEFEVDLAPTAPPIATQVKVQGAFANDGVTRMTIAEVIECVEPGKPFVSAIGIELWETFPR